MPRRLCCRVLRRRRPSSFRPWRKVNSKKRRGLSAALAEGAEEQHLRHAGTGTAREYSAAGGCRNRRCGHWLLQHGVGRYARMGTGSGLSNQSVAQRTTRGASCGRQNVPQALSGYRPKLSVTASGGYNYFRELNKSVNQQAFPNTVIYNSLGESLGTRQFGATATQTLFNGFQTANRTRQAESQVAGARETSSKFFSTPLLPT